MAQQRGSQIEVLLGVESTFGTAPSSAYQMAVNTYNVQSTRALNSAATLTGQRNPVAPFSGNRTVSGDIVIPVDSIAMAQWLIAAFGSPTSSGSDPYTHKFTVPDSQSSYTLEVANTDLTTNRYLQHRGCKISSIGIDIGGDGELTAALGIVGATSSWETSSMDGTPTDNTTLGRLNNFHASLTEGGGAISNVTAASFTIDMGLDTGQYVVGGSGTVGSIPEGIVSVGGSITMLMDDDAYTVVAKGDAETESALVLTLNGGTSSQMIIELQEILYSMNGPVYPGPQGIQVSLDFQGYYTNGSDASSIIFSLVNGVASY